MKWEGTKEEKRVRGREERGKMGRKERKKIKIGKEDKQKRVNTRRKSLD